TAGSKATPGYNSITVNHSNPKLIHPPNESPLSAMNWTQCRTRDAAMQDDRPTLGRGKFKKSTVPKNHSGLCASACAVRGQHLKRNQVDELLRPTCVAHQSIRRH